MQLCRAQHVAMVTCPFGPTAKPRTQLRLSAHAAETSLPLALRLVPEVDSHIRTRPWERRARSDSGRANASAQRSLGRRFPSERVFDGASGPPIAGDAMPREFGKEVPH